jgi:serine protease Do
VAILTALVGTFSATPKIPYLERQTNEIIERAALLEQAVFKVSTPRGSGSGWRYGKQWVITNWHVVRDDPTVTLSQGTEMSWVGPVRYVDPERDLAAIEILSFLPSGQLSVASEAPKSGSWIMTSGAPLGDFGHTTYGHVSKYRIDALSMSIQIAPGSSGSPIIDYNGEVVGVVRAGRIGSMGVAWTIAVSTEALNEFITELERRFP